ncbi:MAG: hypothetical protein GY788_05815 [bacterium]|nr:hypothetical protein [bacterium]
MGATTRKSPMKKRRAASVFLSMHENFGAGIEKMVPQNRNNGARSAGAFFQSEGAIQTVPINLESSVEQGVECVIFFVWQGATTRNSPLLQGVATQPDGK